MTTFIPELMRDEAQRLFPKAPWIPREASPVIDLTDDEKEIEHEGAPEDQVPELSPAEEPKVPLTRKRARLLYVKGKAHKRSLNN